MAESAYKFAKEHITGGKDPRPDDVSKALYPIVEVDETLRGHQDDNRAKGKRFIEWFVEYIIDKYLSERWKNVEKTSK